MNTFESHPWLWSLGLGFPFFAVVVRFYWGAAQISVWRRLMLSFVLACLITPSGMAWTNGHNDGDVVVAPAIAFFLYAIKGGQDAFILLLMGMIPICVVSLVLLGLFSVVIYLRR